MGEQDNFRRLIEQIPELAAQRPDHLKNCALELWSHVWRRVDPSILDEARKILAGMHGVSEDALREVEGKETK